MPVRVGLHDHSGISAKLEGAFHFCSVALEVPTDIDAAGEAEHFHSRIGKQRGDEIVGEGDDIDLARRNSHLMQNLGEQKCRERGFHGGLEQHRIPGGDAGCDFVGDEVQRKIEGRDAENDAEREAANDSKVAKSRGTRFHIDAMAVVAECERGGESKGDAGPVHFGFGKGHRFSSFGDDHIDKLLAALAEELADPLERRGSVIAGKLARFLKCGVRAGYRGFDILRAGRADVGELFTGPGIVDRLGCLRLHPAAVEVERFHGFLDRMNKIS